MKSKVTNSKIPTKFEWGILVFLFAFLFVNFLFPDIILTTNHSISFYDLLSKNDLIHFYSENYIINGPLGTTYMTYDFPIFAIMGLWNIPLLLLQKIFGIVWYNNLISILYAKSILILFAILCNIEFSVFFYFLLFFFFFVFIYIIYFFYFFIHKKFDL